MFIGAISGLLGNLRVMLPILGVLAVGWGATYLFQSWKIGSLQKQVERHITDIGQLKANVFTLRGSIDSQNASIQVLVEIGQARRAVAQDALRATERANEELRRKALEISTAPIPDDPTASCLAGDALILEVYR